MKSSLEYSIVKVWPYLPEGMRIAFTGKFEQFREKANIGITKVNTQVYYVAPEIKVRFPTAEFLELGKGKYSLIATCKNEIRGIGEFSESVKSQTLKPVEVVICDAGSTDGTLEFLEEWARTEDQFSVKVIKADNVNISEGRNIAVKGSREEILLFSDLGTTLDPNLALYLVSAFGNNKSIEFVMGYYKPTFSASWHEALSYFLLPRWDLIEPETFFASGRSMAVSRSLYDKVGGFPEELTHAGEDSLFNFNVRRIVNGIAFVPEAIAHWKMEPDLWKMWKSIFRYAKGDAETGFLFWSYYRDLLIKLSKLGFDLLLFLFFYFVAGYLALILISSVLRFVSYPFLLFGIYRIYILSKEYGVFLEGSIKEKAMKFSVLWYFLSAQVCGFLRGVRQQ
jgi:glycosyltransferase involved in cell wall biosynthesis